MQFKLATDYRFNRRDSLVLQYGFTPYAKAQLAVKVKDLGAAADIDVDNVDLALGTGGCCRSRTIRRGHRLRDSRNAGYGGLPVR